MNNLAKSFPQNLEFEIKLKGVSQRRYHYHIPDVYKKSMLLTRNLIVKDQLSNYLVALDGYWDTIFHSVFYFLSLPSFLQKWQLRCYREPLLFARQSLPDWHFFLTKPLFSEVLEFKFALNHQTNTWLIQPRVSGIWTYRMWKVLHLLRFWSYA